MPPGGTRAALPPSRARMAASPARRDSSPLDAYLRAVAAVRRLPGTPETSYYPALKALLDGVGETLRPRVAALPHPKASAAGQPDFGLFSADVFGRGDARAWRGEDITPDRGVVELKGAAHPIEALVASEQVRDRYLPRYGLVLATNLWRFRLLDRDGTTRESYDLADTEAGFWALADRATPPPDTTRRAFEAFLARCLLADAPVARPADLAFLLASYAREALATLDARADLPALRDLRAGMEASLGLAFDERDGERLFRSSLVQALFYGVFSAWAVEARTGDAARFDWRTAGWSLTVPVARFLFGQVATPDALRPLGLVPLLDGAARALGRVDAAAFFAAFDEAGAVRHFYEPFLEHFDPDTRRALGVWYTPPEVVTYMVERVDRVLRAELGLADGLADESVTVLDPCCGTGSYPVAVLDRIRRTLDAQGLGDLAAERLRRAATERVVGFEIMPAPLLIAHWQVAEALRRAGAPLRAAAEAGTNAPERAAIFLTNALTGWVGDEEAGSLEGRFEALAAERAAALAVKQRAPVLVVVGNPPYNAFAGVAPDTERGLLEPYKAGLSKRWGVKKNTLDDLYIRFIRIAERRVADVTGRGVVCLISNHSWLTGASNVVMREHILNKFDEAWVDLLHGDSRETGKLCPDGSPDPSVFSTPMNREGIRVGTAVITLVRRGAR